MASPAKTLFTPEQYLALEREADATFGHHDKLFAIGLAAPFDDGRSRADEIRHGEDLRRAFRMSDDLGAGVLYLRLSDAPCRKGGMHDTSALPDLHIATTGLALDVGPQVAIGKKQDSLLRRNRVDHLHGIARRAQDVFRWASCSSRRRSLPRRRPAADAERGCA